MPRYRIVAICKAEGCKEGVTARSRKGLCRRHRDIGRPKRAWDKSRWEAWLSIPGNPERYRATIRAWNKRNPEKVKRADREYQKRRRDAATLAAADEAKKKAGPLSVRNAALVERANARAAQVNYGIQRVAYS